MQYTIAIIMENNPEVIPKILISKVFVKTPEVVAKNQTAFVLYILI